MSGLTFDAGGLIALDRKDRKVVATVAHIRERNLRLTVPATALSQVIRNPARQVPLSWFIGHRQTDLVALDEDDAIEVGQLLARTGTSDIVDAHVVICAMRADQPVITSDPADLRRLAPSLQLIPV